jgi:hypothetical protein
MEKGKEILKDAIKRLPNYAPNSCNWEAINKKLDIDHKVLDSFDLPQIAPPDSVWEKIESDINLDDTIRKLPKYNPPSFVWDRIVSNINFSNENKRQKIRLHIWIPSLVAALLIVSFFLFRSPNESVENGKPFEKNTSSQSVWEVYDTEIEQTIELICSQNPKSCLRKEFKDLENDLVALTLSRQNILNQMGTSNTNSEWDLLLAEIELKRSDILKEMIQISI